VHISYFDGTSGYLGYATNSPWRMKTIQTLGTVGSSTSLAIDAQGALHMSYYDVSNTDLRYANNSGGAWSSIALDSTNQVGSSNRLALDANGKVHISYYDSLNGNLKYATNAGGSWLFDTIDSIGSVGSYTSIVVDANGKVHISYYDDTNDDLKYATNAGGSWFNWTVDSTGNVGMYTSIGLDASGKAHISYYDVTNTALKYANNTGGSWSTTSVDWIDNVGRFSSLLVDSEGKVHISYEKETGGDLMYATNAAGSWISDTVDGTADIRGSQYTSMAMDRHGVLHISYYDDTNDDLRYANNVGGKWSHDVVDRKGDMGRSSSIAMDWNGVAHILYLDFTSNGVKLASLNAEPSEPTNMQAMREGLDAEISWDAPLLNNGYPVDGYVVRRTSEDGRTELTHLTHVYTSYRDEGLANGVYNYSVAARNIMGVGPFCAGQEVNISTEVAVAPSAPIGLTAVGNETLIYLAWSVPNNDGGSQITGYKVYRGTTYGSETFIQALGTQTFFHDELVSGGVNYYYKVSAVNAVGESPLSEGAVGSLLAPPTVPGPPRDLNVDNGSSYVQLTWNAPSSDGGSPVTGYNIYRNTNMDAAPVLLASVGDQLGYNDTTAINGITYHYRVSAVNVVGEGPLTEPEEATPYTVPGEPRNLRATFNGIEVILDWDAPLSDGGSAVNGYKVYRGIASDSMSLRATLGVEHQYVDEFIAADQAYYYKVQAINDRGEGPFSETVLFDPNLPSAPTLDASLGLDFVSLVWQAPSSTGSSEIIGYNVYRGEASGNLALLASLGNTTHYMDENVTKGHAYYYRVSANNSAGEGQLSNEVSMMVGSIPSEPRDLVATAGNATVTLIWQAPEDDGGWAITSYNIYRTTVAGAETILATVGNVLTYTDSSVTNGVTYYYRVSAVNAVGEGPLGEAEGAMPQVDTENGDGDEDEDDDGNNTMLYIIIAIVAIAAIAGVAVFLLKKRK
jgi:fibronectin type 3 domain-containing protein